MFLRGTILGFWVFFSSVSWGAEICERLLKKDFRETSNIRLAYNDVGVVLKENGPFIDKIRFGSSAFESPISTGDQIIEINGEDISNIEEDNVKKFLATRNVSLKVIGSDGEAKTISLERTPYLGHPIVEFDIILRDIEIIQQSSKTSLDFEVHLKWRNEDLIHKLPLILGLDKAKFADNEDSEIKCIFRKSAELENILQKIWYPNFDASEITSFINRSEFHSLLVTSNKPYNFHLVQKINYQANNISEFQKFPFDRIVTSAGFVFQDTDLNTSELYNTEFVIDRGNEYLYEWEITHHDLDCCPTKIYGQGVQQEVFFNYELTRKSFYYILKIILPVIFLVYLSFSVFWIPARELESKLAVSLGSLLTLVVFQFTFGDGLPKINKISILDAWILISYLFTGLSTIITIWSYWDYHKDHQTGRYNTIDKKLFWSLSLSYFLFMAIFGWGIKNNWNTLNIGIPV